MRRVPEWVREQTADEAPDLDVYNINRTINCVVRLRLHRTGEILFNTLAALGAELDAQAQAQPQQAKLRLLRDALRAGEAHMHEALERRWLAVRMAVHRHLGANSPARVIGDDGLAQAMMSTSRRLRRYGGGLAQAPRNIPSGWGGLALRGSFCVFPGGVASSLCPRPLPIQRLTLSMDAECIGDTLTAL